MFKGLPENEEGASAIEYSLLAGLIALALVPALTAIGINVGNIFPAIVETLATANGG